MIIAWILCMITVVGGLVSQLGHSAALQIRLLAIEQEAHTAFVAAERKLYRCEAQLSNTTPLAVLSEGDASSVCNITVVDANATAELIRIRVIGNAALQNSMPSESNRPKQLQLESMVYRDKRDHTIKRLSWRVLWSATQSIWSRLA
jgi:hypothetical protein